MLLTPEEVAKHNTAASCWVIIHERVYDVTDFLDKHPGGATVILMYAGKDATEEYDLIHPPGILESELAIDKNLGALERPPDGAHNTDGDTNTPKEESLVTPLPLLLCLDEFEAAARKVLSERAWTYYSSVSGRGSSNTQNISQWSLVSFRPRVLRNVLHVNMQRIILGHRSQLPIFISPCALGRLHNPDGEICLVKGAVARNISYIVSMASSVAHADLMSSWTAANAASTQTRGRLFYQLYVKKDPAETRKLIQNAKFLRFGGLVVTVDTPVVGKRDEDDRYKAKQLLTQNSSPSTWSYSPVAQSEGPDVPIPRSPYSSTLSWEDLGWISREWGQQGPLCLKGITSVKDVVMAMNLGYTSIYLSNHGGRQLDGAPSALTTLLEIRKFHPGVFQKCEILLDGGVRRGSDVIKALALGATAVGIGRPFMYALSTHGVDGVVKAIDIMSDEIETDMRLLGVTSLDQLSPQTVNSCRLEAETVETLSSLAVYEGTHRAHGTKL